MGVFSKNDIEVAGDLACFEASLDFMGLGLRVQGLGFRVSGFHNICFGVCFP